VYDEPDAVEMVRALQRITQHTLQKWPTRYSFTPVLPTTLDRITSPARFAVKVNGRRGWLLVSECIHTMLSDLTGKRWTPLRGITLQDGLYEVEVVSLAGNQVELWISIQRSPTCLAG